MTFEEFLKHSSLLKTLYGSEVARAYYEKNIDSFYDFEKDELRKLISSTEKDLPKSRTKRTLHSS